VLVGAWVALVVAAAAFVIGFLQGGLVLLYVAIAASAVSMTLVIGYLLRPGRSGRGRRTEAAEDTDGTTTGPGSG
jgi:hypothetical protein